MFAVGGHHEFALGSGLDAVLFHQLEHPVFAHTNPARQQLLVHARPAVFAFDLGVDSSLVGKHGFVAVAPSRPCALWRAQLFRLALGIPRTLGVAAID